MPTPLRSAALLLLFAACTSPEPPAYSVGETAVPEGVVASLSAEERELYFDLVAFGTAVAQDDLDGLGARIIARGAAAEHLASLPYLSAAAARGWGEEDLRAAYASSPEWELRVRHIVRLVDEGANAAADAAAREIAEEAHTRAVAGEDFGSLAGSFSEEPGAAERGGALQPGRRGSWVDSFWEAAAALEPGEISNVTRSEYGYHIIRLDERSVVPFEEASRVDLLPRVVPPAEAAAAMEAWAASEGSILVDPPAAAQLRDAILGATPPSDTLVVARGSAGGEYTGADAAAGWALLSPERRRGLEGEGGGDAFIAWLEEDAREVIWARLAERAGADLPPMATERAAGAWSLRASTLARAFGFHDRLTPERLPAAAHDALRSGAAEARAARIDLRGLRPLLRSLYPVVPPAR